MGTTVVKYRNNGDFRILAIDCNGTPRSYSLTPDLKISAEVAYKKNGDGYWRQKTSPDTTLIYTGCSAQSSNINMSLQDVFNAINGAMDKNRMFVDLTEHSGPNHFDKDGAVIANKPQPTFK